MIIDNAPVTDASAEVVRSAARRGPVSYLAEPRAGLSFARNAAVAVAAGEILAWIDDDEYADVHWLAEVARALAEHPEADVVSGVIVPAELETPAQLWFEQFGGHSKGRGFRPDVFSPATAHRQSPLYPLPLNFVYNDLEMATPYVHHFNTSFQRQLSNDFMVDIAYVGRFGYKLEGHRHFNPAQFIRRGKIRQTAYPKIIQKQRGRSESARTPHDRRSSHRFDQAALEQRLHHSVDRHATNLFDLGAGQRLPISDNCQSLERGLR